MSGLVDNTVALFHIVTVLLAVRRSDWLRQHHRGVYPRMEAMVA
jgi:hypothetical protein